MPGAMPHGRQQTAQTVATPDRDGPWLLHGRHGLPASVAPFRHLETEVVVRLHAHAQAGEWHQRLKQAGITADLRGDRLRLGFGLYQKAADAEALLARLAGLV